MMNSKKLLPLLPAVFLLPPAQTTEAREKPNIIFFLVDDMGWQDTSLPFWSEKTYLNETYRTPNMERLAAKGVKFTQAYACPVSTPSRVSLMTGANVAQHHVSNWTFYKDKPNDKPSDRLGFGKWNCNGMSSGKGYPNTFYAKALPALLHESGYRTCLVGKAHFGALDTPAADPVSIGFDCNIGGHGAGSMGSYLGEENYGNKAPGMWTRPRGVPSLEKYHGTDVFLTEALTREACRFMEEAVADKQPFFLYMSHYAVHVPFKADKRFYGKYAAKGMEPAEAQYASLLEGMDKSLGDLMDWLEEKGIAGNTIVIFMSDNGGFTTGRGGEQARRNYPLRGGKGSCFEGGIRVPLIVYHPEVKRPGTENVSLVGVEDILPTVLEMAGIAPGRTPQHIDGISFFSYLKNGSSPDGRALYFHYPNNWGGRKEDVGVPQSAIRKGDWKLVHYYETGKNELYNLSEDISETNDLMTDERYIKIGRSLAGELSRFLKKNGSNMPYDKRTGEPVPYPDGSR